MSTPLPELPIDPDVEFTATALTASVSGQLLLVFPFRYPEGASRGRRYLVHCGTERSVRVVFKLHDRTGCRPVGAFGVEERVLVTLRALRVRRKRRVPPDVEAALRDAGVGLDGLSEPEVRHLLLMVTEARDPAIRAERVRIAVQAARVAT